MRSRAQSGTAGRRRSLRDESPRCDHVHRCVGCRADAGAATDHSRPPSVAACGAGCDLPGRDSLRRNRRLQARLRRSREELHHRRDGVRRRVLGFRQRRLRRSLPRQRLDPRSSATRRSRSGCRALPQQRGRDFRGRYCCARRRERALGARRVRRRHRQRRLRGFVRHELRQEPPLPQRSGTGVPRCRGRGDTSRSTAGRPVVRSATSTAMDGSTCSLPVTSASTSISFRHRRQLRRRSTPRRLARLATAPRASARRTLQAHRSARIARSA